MATEEMYLFYHETRHKNILVQAETPSDAREKLGAQFPAFEDADCLGNPNDIMDRHTTPAVMLH